MAVDWLKPPVSLDEILMCEHIEASWEHMFQTDGKSTASVATETRPHIYQQSKFLMPLCPRRNTKCARLFIKDKHVAM